jgi:hypothetical protein
MPFYRMSTYNCNIILLIQICAESGGLPVRLDILLQIQTLFGIAPQELLLTLSGQNIFFELRY